MNIILSSRRRHYLARLSVFLITVALIGGTVNCDGDGYTPTSQNLEISTWYDLNAVRENMSGNHTLMNDLDSTTLGYTELASPTANGGKGWEPIGYSAEEVSWGCSRYRVDYGFIGTFDGQGYEIRDLYINRPDEDVVGLFGLVDAGGSFIQDIGMVKAAVIGGSAVGSLVGSNDGTVRNSFSIGSVTGVDGVGGLVGSNSGTIINSYSSGNVTGEERVGILAGNSKGAVSNSYSTGNVTGHDDVGGLVGENSGTVSNSHFTGNVVGTWAVGGLVGANRDGTVNDSYSSGRVTGEYGVGGLVGYIGRTLDGTVSDSYSTASVTGEAGVGGLVGDNQCTQWSWSGDPYCILPWPGVPELGINVNNSYYDYDDNLINGKNIITIGALSGEDFDQWLANDKSLDINERLSQEDGYYLINDVSDFKQLLAFGQNTNLKFRLTSDLNLATEPGLYIPYLAGEFDGNGHKISNLSFNSGFVCNVGLFGYLGRAGEVSQVGVENINITGVSSVGGLVGQSWGTVSDSYTSGTVTGKKFNVGGLVGSNTKSTVKVGDKEWNAPGIVSNSSSNVSVSGGDVVGGLVGSNFFGTVSRSYCTGSVTGCKYVGGLVGTGDFGLGDTGNVTDSYFTGSVTGEDDVGGLAGFGLGGNSHYNYDEVLINGEHIVTVGALSGEDFDQWLANDKFLDVNGRLSQENGYYLISDVNDLKQLLAFGQNDTLKFRLTNDLDLTAEPNFYIPYLAGEFDGNSHRISNLSFEFEFVSYVGLFGFLAPGGNITRVGNVDVNVSGNYYVGGLVGFSSGGVDHSYSTGSVTGNRFVGGLAGYNLGTVSNSHSTIGVTGDQRVGGLVGWNDYGWSTDGIVSNSYSIGSVTGNWAVGGLVGVNYVTINNSYSTGSVTGDEHVGGLAGLGVGTVSNSFWDRKTSGRPFSSCGTRKTTAQMKNIATFSGAGWNIIAVAPGETNDAYTWNIIDKQTYPFLSWES